MGFVSKILVAKEKARKKSKTYFTFFRRLLVEVQARHLDPPERLCSIPLQLIDNVWLVLQHEPLHWYGRVLGLDGDDAVAGAAADVVEQHAIASRVLFGLLGHPAKVVDARHGHPGRRRCAAVHKGGDELRVALQVAPKCELRRPHGKGDGDVVLLLGLARPVFVKVLDQHGKSLDGQAVPVVGASNAS